VSSGTVLICSSNLSLFTAQSFSFERLGREVLSVLSRRCLNAFNQPSCCSDRDRRRFVADQPIYPDGFQHQDHFERGGSDRSFDLRPAVRGHFGEYGQLAAEGLRSYAARLSIQREPGAREEFM
jgi:hypothetical protein